MTKPNTFPHNRVASVATLRWCSGSSRNAVRLNSGTSVQLRRNPHPTWIIEFTAPDSKVIHKSGKTVQVFYPKANSVEIYDVSKFSHSIDEVILLGFGTSSTELKKTYEIKLAGSDSVNGVRTSRLELTPKTEEMRKLVTRIELWIPEGQSSPLQEKLTQPSKNYSLVSFSDLKINPLLQDADVALTLPAGVERIYPQR